MGREAPDPHENRGGRQPTPLGSGPKPPYLRRGQVIMQNHEHLLPRLAKLAEHSLSGAKKSDHLPEIRGEEDRSLLLEFLNIDAPAGSFSENSI